MGEGQWMPRIAQALCNGCGACIAACPSQALGWQAGKAGLLRPDQCSYCAACENICPVNAITLPYLVVKTSISSMGEL